MPTSASDISKKIYENARRSCARHTTAVAAVGGGSVRGLVRCGQDVVLHQCGSMCLTSESIVSRLTSNHELYVRHDSRPHRHLPSLIKRPRQWLRLHEQRSRTVEAVMKVRASARATAADHPRIPAAAPPAQRISEHQGPDKQLPASSDEAQM